MDNTIENKIYNDALPIKSGLVTLKSIVEDNIFFTIPIYQRLYVWEEDQVNTLLEDVFRAAQKKEPHYYLGGIMTTKSNNKDENVNNHFLIDGQQRFTTLWLLAYELKGELKDFVEVVIKGKTVKKRISFSIRDFANNFLENPEKIEQFSDDDKKQLQNILDAKATINDFLKDKDGDRELITSYVYNNLSLIHTIMPNEIDENRLFEVLNNRGEQLKHQDILKSKLIEQLSDDEKTKYAQLWDSCSIMDEYIEKNIKEISGLKWGYLTFNELNSDEEKEVGLPGDILNRLTKTEIQEKIHFSEILKSDYKYDKESDDIIEYDSGQVRSIISFPMFLLHSLRIFIFEKEGSGTENIIEVNEKKLLEIFETYFYENYLNSSDSRKFIELVWKLRIKFDKYVIKWVELDHNTEHHLIKPLYLNKKTLQRRIPTSNEGFALLQSMLYHSQQIITHYWLTPFMYKMLYSDSKNELYSYLKKLDNKMFCTGMKEGLRERSWILINDNHLNDRPIKINHLLEAKGTSYWSYWFYKLDFILWHEKRKEKGSEWENFRMTKKNSVEHISPQNPKEYDEHKVWDDADDEETKRNKLDDFGNLVLITSSQNSSYGHQTFREKRTTFRERKRMDSLKSDLIFEDDKWNWGLCEGHRNEMIELFEDYFKKNSNG